MKRILLLIYFISIYSFSQNNTPSFKDGELIKYKINYGLLNAGFATLEISNYVKDQDTLYHVNGNGWTTGMTDFFFPVNDNYQTYFNQQTLKPTHFIRKIDEGGYKKNKEIYFDFNKHYAKVINHKRQTEKSFFIQNDVQDMLSSLYYLRSIDFENLKENDTIHINMFFDEQMNRIKLRIKGRSTIHTKFGKVRTIVLKPMVQAGRVFNDKENVTIWITDDKNKIPIKIKAGIIVGSIKAELIEYRGLTNPFPIIFN